MSDQRAFYQGEEIKYKITKNDEVIHLDYEGLEYKFKMINLEHYSIIQNLESGEKSFISHSEEGVILNGKFVDLVKRKSRSLSEDSLGNNLLTPMPGKIIKIYVKKGDQISAGDKLFVMEAMKMEHTITSSVDAIVSEVKFGEADQVEANVEVVVLSETKKDE